MDDTESLWTAAAQLLRAQVSDAVWLSTFNDVAVVPANGAMVLAVPSSAARERLEGRYLPMVHDALAEVGGGHIELRLEVRTAPSERTLEPLPARPSTTERSGPRAEAHNVDRTGEVLNQAYTFENFVVGTSNRFAHAAALGVAETPARAYNPLFIYSVPGLGKTHLLHAIGHYVRQNYPLQMVRYVTAETFLNDYIDAVRTGTTPNLRKRYREVDVLLIDDIQVIERSEGLQEEFFHTFNSLHGANKQIVISSDRTPDAMQTLEDRLRGRFRWGLITDIQPPDIETRIAILRNKSERDNTLIAPEVLEFIATHVTSNIRELEGALIRIAAYQSLNRVPVTVPLAERVLADLLNQGSGRMLTPAAMLELIAGYFGFTVEALTSKSRQRPLVSARQVGMYVFRELTDLSYPAIARLFGKQDHTTVIHAVDKISRLMRERQQVYDQVTELSARIKSGR